MFRPEIDDSHLEVVREGSEIPRVQTGCYFAASLRLVLPLVLDVDFPHSTTRLHHNFQIEHV